MAASSRVEPCKYDVLLLGYDRTLATGDADEEAIGRSEDFACTLVEYLETKCNLKVFFDCRDVDLGQSVFDARFDVFKKSKFIVPVMCPAFIQDCWSKYITESAFVDRLGSAQFIPVCVLGVTQQDTKDKLKNYRVIKCLYFKAEAVLPEDDLQALDKLRRALTAGVSQPVQDDRNNEGQGDVSNEETISQPQEETAPPCEDITGQGRDAVEDGSGENSVQGWMGSLSSFLRDVAPAIWTCILYTENSTPQLFPAKNNAKNGHCKD
ncbi:uncharacterized protein LOC106177431 isoform X1 [Lingula anatina]|uniref:Uncharacterized protein LOC106177431 isoform X1 n=1 Tax=Lingula anatina TaxID=7574 RepID=A0A1S3JZX1_LINAN|nr:uncharacterized protein LOC106177431 isoform X1 [Lingula anatina]|eukprot:XP_013415649.1 uncharacterized protein LOC106177431 isoform X1 [Lingula anatina]